MEFSANMQNMEATQPVFPAKVKKLVQTCQRMSHKDFVEIMGVSPRIARDVEDYYQRFFFPDAPQQPASLAYTGVVYRGLNAHDFTRDDFAFAQERLNIISGLYGIARPLDAIKPHRLDMGGKVVPYGYRSLYAFWLSELIEYMVAKLKKDEPLINLASLEHSKIFKRWLTPKGIRMIDVQFLEMVGEEMKQVVVHTKKARGLFARFIIKNRIEDPEELKGFDAEGYGFSHLHSKENTWLFIR